MAKKISKKTFTIFVVLAILVLVGFLFYSFNKKSNLFEGQASNENASETPALIDKHYPATMALATVPFPSCPRGFERTSDGKNCKMKAWSQNKAACNNNTYTTQDEYDACVNNS